MTRVRGYSSAGRALAWHARGQRFDPAYLHHHVSTERSKVLTLSSRGLGHHPFTVSTGVRIPVGSPSLAALKLEKAAKQLPRGVVVQLVRIPACHAGGRGFESRPLRQFYGLQRNLLSGSPDRNRSLAVSLRGYSSAGRALAWHARGQRFDPAYLHQAPDYKVQFCPGPHRLEA